MNLNFSIYNRAKRLAPTALLALASIFGAKAYAGSLTFTGSGTNSLSHPISAAATFDTYAAGGVNYLTITLTNTYATVIHAGGVDVLTGMFFDPGSGVVLTPTTDGLSAGSVMLPSGTAPSLLETNWGFTETPGTVAGMTPGDWAIGATGLIGGNVTYDFTGVYHHSSGYLGGPNYGILGNAVDTFGGFSPLVASSIQFNFTYTGATPTFSAVDFLYGTSNGEGYILSNALPAVPDGGATVMMVGVAFVGLSLLRRRSSRG